MEHKDFLHRAERGELSGVYLFTGPEEYLKEETLVLIRKTLLPEGFEALNETVLEDADAEKVTECALAVPFMSDKRLVIAKDPLFIKKAKEEEDGDEQTQTDSVESARTEEPADGVQNLIQTDLQSSVVILYMRGECKKSKIVNLLAKQDRVVQFSFTKDPGELVEFVKTKCRERKCDITLDAIDTLISSVGHSRLELLAEVEKLTAFKGRGTIDIEDVWQTASVNMEETVFQMIDLMLLGQTARAYLILNELLSRNEPPVVILSLVTRQLRLMAHAKALSMRGEKTDAIQKKLGVKDWSVRKLVRQTERTDLGKLVKAYRKSTQTDFSIKQGQIQDLMGLHEMMINLKKSAEKP